MVKRIINQIVQESFDVDFLLLSFYVEIILVIVGFSNIDTVFQKYVNFKQVLSVRSRQ